MAPWFPRGACHGGGRPPWHDGAVVGSAAPEPAVRLAEEADLPLLDAIEEASDRLYQPLGIWPLPPMSPGARGAEAARTVTTFVAGRPPVAMLRLEQVDGALHVGQVGVVPEHTRRRIGTRLMLAAVSWGRDRGYVAITLTTFADVAFNAPWYRSLGFAEIDPPYGPELSAVLAEEADLEKLGRRVVMSLAL